MAIFGALWAFFVRYARAIDIDIAYCQGHDKMVKAFSRLGFAVCTTEPFSVRGWKHRMGGDVDADG